MDCILEGLYIHASFFQFAVNEISWNEMDVYVIVLFWILKGKLKKPKKRHRAYRNTMYLPSRDFCLDSVDILSGYCLRRVNDERKSNPVRMF